MFKKRLAKKLVNQYVSLYIIDKIVLWQPLVRRLIATQAINLKVNIKWRSQENLTRSPQYIATLFIL